MLLRAKTFHQILIMKTIRPSFNFSFVNKDILTNSESTYFHITKQCSFFRMPIVPKLLSNLVLNIECLDSRWLSCFLWLHLQLSLVSMEYQYSSSFITPLYRAHARHTSAFTRRYVCFSIALSRRLCLRRVWRILGLSLVWLRICQVCAELLHRCGLKS